MLINAWALLAVKSNIMIVLSNREKEVLLLIGKRMTSKQIALELGISPRTIHFYLENAYWKLGVSGIGARYRAYEEAFKQGLLN